MTSPPPEGMARAYVNITDGPSRGLVRIWTGEVFEAKAKAGAPTPLGPKTVRFQVERAMRAPIPEWNDVDWEGGAPEYVMAPPEADKWPESECWLRSMGEERNCRLVEEELRNPIEFAKSRDFPALYKRHGSHPEVLVRVWKREEAPRDRRAGPSVHTWTDQSGVTWDTHVPISEVDWEAVHRGELVPPVRVEASSVPRRTGDTHIVVTLRGYVCGWGGNHYDDQAAHYDLHGNLLGYRTAEGWKTVKPQPSAGHGQQEGAGRYNPDDRAGSMSNRDDSMERHAPGPGGTGSQAGESPAPTRGSWVDGEWVPSEEAYNERPRLAEKYVPVSDTVVFDAASYARHKAKLRARFDATVPFQVGAEPVKMSEEFQRYLRLQQEGRR